MTNRRTFIKQFITSAIAATALANQQAHSSPISKQHSSRPVIKGKRLSKGDTIGLIAPSSNVWEDEEIYFAMDVLKSFGFSVKPGKHLFQRHTYLAGQDKDRASDVNAMFADESVDAIFCLRGGYGSPRILPYLDYELIGRHPKAIIGYSDVTALLNAIYSKTGLITFHGPIAAQNFSDYTLKNFKNLLFTPKSPMRLAEPPAFAPKEGSAEKENRITRVQSGQAKGRLIGGNLSLMVKLIGTPYEPDYKNNILFLEDIEEPPYKVDGMLTHLKIAGRLQQLSGIAFGKCSDCEATSNSMSIEEVIKDRLGDLGIPVVKGLMIGHIKDMATIPVGSLATLDANNKTLTLEEDAVS